jgi:hypothetical protein
MVEQNKVHPKVRWAQRHDVVSVCVDMQEVPKDDWKMDLSEEGVFSFYAKHVGVEYEFEIKKFWGEIDVTGAKMTYNNRYFLAIIPKVD